MLETELAGGGTKARQGGSRLSQVARAQRDRNLYMRVEGGSNDLESAEGNKLKT